MFEIRQIAYKQYQVLDSDGIDCVGEYVGLAEAKRIAGKNFVLVGRKYYDAKSGRVKEYKLV